MNDGSNPLEVRESIHSSIIHLLKGSLDKSSTDRDGGEEEEEEEEGADTDRDDGDDDATAADMKTCIDSFRDDMTMARVDECECSDG